MSVCRSIPIIFLSVGLIGIPSSGCAKKSDPMTAQEFLEKGQERFARGEHEDALIDFTEAIRLDPNLAAAFDGRGMAWGKKDEHDKAIKDFDEAIRIDPTRETAFYNRGISWQSKREFNKAVQTTLKRSG